MIGRTHQRDLRRLREAIQAGEDPNEVAARLNREAVARARRRRPSLRPDGEPAD